MRTSTTLIALGLAGALSIGAAAPSLAGPLMSSGAAVRTAAPDHVTDVQWRGRARGRSIGPGLALGLAAGAFIAADVAARSYGPDYYYQGGPAYGAYEGPVYAEPDVYAPAYPAPRYYAPSYGYGQCFTNDGYGRRLPCGAN